MLSIENMLYIIENLDQFGYNDLKHLGFNDIQIDKLLSGIFESVNSNKTDINYVADKLTIEIGENEYILYGLLK